MSDHTQEILWNQAHSATNKQVPGKLAICIGLPVMIRHNVSTELCITTGQEGEVVGWESATGKHGKPVLNYIFIHLHNPPSEVNVPSLPQNVVPLVPTKVNLKCDMPDDSEIRITRTQV